MNMGKKKWAILLIIALVLGTGSYVFANPSLDSSKDSLNPDHSVKKQDTNKSGNQNVDVVINQDELNVNDLENMDIPEEEVDILEQIIMNSNANAAANNSDNNGNIVNSNLNNGGNTGSTIPGNTNGSGNNQQENNSSNNGGNSNTGSDNGSNSGNTGSTDTTTNPGENTGSGTGSTGNNGETDTDHGNSEGGNNTENNNQEENLPSFVFEENGTFSTNTILINDPNYDHMIVYNWNTNQREVIYENEYTIEVDNAIYVFIVFDKEGNYQGFTMHHVKAEQ